MYLSERYLEMLQNADVEEPKSSQQKNGKVQNSFWFCSRDLNVFLSGQVTWNSVCISPSLTNINGSLQTVD